MTDNASESHNTAIVPLLKLLVDAAPSESDQWVLLETLCLGIGHLHQRSPRQTAEYIDTMADRITSGERKWLQR